MRKLEWESHFFARDIAILENFNELDVDELSIHQLIMSKVSSKNYKATDYLSKLGFYFVEGEMYFEKKIDCEVPESFELLEPVSEACFGELPQLVALAKLSYTLSRFRAPWFSDDERKLFYGTWVENAVHKSFDDICYVYKTDEEVQGFITLKRQVHKLNIGLIAVKKDVRGKGIARLLLQTAEAYAREQNCHLLAVATQSSNLGAANLYSKFGFSLTEINNWFYKGNI